LGNTGFNCPQCGCKQLSETELKNDPISCNGFFLNLQELPESNLAYQGYYSKIRAQFTGNMEIFVNDKVESSIDAGFFYVELFSVPNSGQGLIFCLGNFFLSKIPEKRTIFSKKNSKICRNGF